MAYSDYIFSKPGLIQYTPMDVAGSISIALVGNNITHGASVTYDIDSPIFGETGCRNYSGIGNSDSDFICPINTDFTFLAWVKILDNTKDFAILAQDGTHEGNRARLFWYDSFMFNSGGNNGFAIIHANSRVESNPNVDNAGSWILIAAASDRATGSKIYVNGIDESFTSSTSLSSLSTLTTNVSIGSWDDIKMLGNARVAHQMVFDHKLTSFEILGIYNEAFKAPSLKKNNAAKLRRKKIYE